MSRRSSLFSLFSKPSPKFPDSIQKLGTFLTSLNINKPETIEAQVILLSLLHSPIADIRTAKEHEGELLTLSTLVMSASSIKGDQLSQSQFIFDHLIDIIEDQRKQLKRCQSTTAANEVGNCENATLLMTRA